MDKKKLLLIVGLVFIVFLLIAVTSIGILIFMITSHGPDTEATGIDPCEPAGFGWITPLLNETHASADGEFKGVFKNGAGARINVTKVTAVVYMEKPDHLWVDASCNATSITPAGLVPAGGIFKAGCSVPLLGKMRSVRTMIEYDLIIGGIATHHSVNGSVGGNCLG